MKQLVLVCALAFASITANAQTAPTTPAEPTVMQILAQWAQATACMDVVSKELDQKVKLETAENAIQIGMAVVQLYTQLDTEMRACDQEASQARQWSCAANAMNDSAKIMISSFGLTDLEAAGGACAYLAH